MAFRIENCWLFVSTDDDGEEGVIGQLVSSPVGGAQWMPFVCTDEKRVDSLRPMAKAVAEASGIQVTLVRFSGQREELEVYGC
jgi:hypothetical protein